MTVNSRSILKDERERVINIAFFLKKFMTGKEKFSSLDDLVKFIDSLAKKFEFLSTVKNWEKWKLELLLKKVNFVARSIRKEKKLKVSLERKFKGIKIQKVEEYDADKFTVFYVYEGKSKAVSGSAREIKQKLLKEIKK
ncbi:MAG: hypothetical protein OWQ50_04930 [Acidianus infernus]|uniref:hypothetical protein n=1 Tax=Acidianus infernus TaxID=12915 RepID=UPI002273CE8C|nr:hypothetical protein [Acidianus infernus]MCY0883140.1 hypothetical protein [Acidianus infernus]